MTRTCITDCPECYQVCGWCSWYRKHARAVGCGNFIDYRKCGFGQAEKGVQCSTCDGSGRVRATVTYERVRAADETETT